MAESSQDQKNNTSNEDRNFSIKKITPFFIDDIANISINPNGACRLQFATWQTDEENKPVRVDSEIIMTINTMKMLTEALPRALTVAEEEIKKIQKEKNIQ